MVAFPRVSGGKMNMAKRRQRKPTPTTTTRSTPAHNLQVWNYPKVLAEQQRLKWETPKDYRRALAALASLTLDETADESVLQAIEDWALTEGRRLEREAQNGHLPNFDGLVARLTKAIMIETAGPGESEDGLLP